MAKKKVVKKNKKKNRRLSWWAVVLLLCITGYCAFHTISELITTIRLQQELAEAQTELQKANDNSTYLNAEKEKLQDPDYVENYARGKYMLTKDGEQIFHLPENSDK